MFLGMDDEKYIDRGVTSFFIPDCIEYMKEGNVLCHSYLFDLKDPRHSVPTEKCDAMSPWASSHETLRGTGPGDCNFRMFPDDNYHFCECRHPRAKELAAETDVELALERL